MQGGGRSNANPQTSTVLRGRAQHQSYYNSLQRVRVQDLHIERGTVEVAPLNGGTPYEVPIPLIGLSIPPPLTKTDNNFLRASWGVYYPQIEDILIVGFDTIGNPLCLGFSAIEFNVMKQRDDANEDRGGIGWADASGKRLRPGDFSFKSARNSTLYLGDRARIGSGPHSITLDKPNGEIVVQSDLVHTRYGAAGEIRAGSARRILVPGVDTQESYVPSLINPPSPAQEYVNYVRRGALTAPGGQLLMVQEAAGEIVDDLTGVGMVPAVAYPDLAVALTGPFARKLTSVKDDATGVIDMHAEVVDNLGNWGVTAKTAVGFQWFTPMATWTIVNNLVNWTTTTSINITAGATMSLTATGTMNLTSPVVNLGGVAATDFLVKGTTFMTEMMVFMTGLNTFLAAFLADPALSAVLPATKTALGTFVPISAQFQAKLMTTLSTVSKTV